MRLPAHIRRGNSIGGRKPPASRMAVGAQHTAAGRRVEEQPLPARRQGFPHLGRALQIERGGHGSDSRRSDRSMGFLVAPDPCC